MKYLKGFKSTTVINEKLIETENKFKLNIITNFSEKKEVSNWIDREAIFDLYYSKFGPYIHIEDNNDSKLSFLGQKRDSEWVFFDSNDRSATLEDIANKIRVDVNYLEQSLEKFIND